MGGRRRKKDGPKGMNQNTGHQTKKTTRTRLHPWLCLLFKCRVNGRFSFSPLPTCPSVFSLYTINVVLVVSLMVLASLNLWCCAAPCLSRGCPRALWHLRPLIRRLFLAGAAADGGARRLPASLITFDRLVSSPTRHANIYPRRGGANTWGVCHRVKGAHG